MTREEETQFEQDRFGNENRKLDTLRAREGMLDSDSQGITEITSANTSSVVTLYSLPTHADRAIPVELHAYNGDSVDGTYSIYDAELDGSNNVTASTRRSVPIEVTSQSTRINSIHGEPVEEAIAVSSDFEGWVAVGVIADHDQENEPQVEQTS